MAQQEPPKITFPCDGYMIKVIGDADVSFTAFVYSVLVRYDEQLKRDSLSVKPSRNGRFESITVSMRIEREQHLTDLFHELKADDRIRMVL